MINVTFTGTIGVEVRGNTWPCVNWPDSKQILGTGKATKISGTVNDYPIKTALMPNGQGNHMLPLNKTILKAINKKLGDSVTVFIKDLA